MAEDNRYDITGNRSIRQYSTWGPVEITEIDFDLSGYSAKMQIRSKKNNSLLLELSTSNGMIVINPSESKITLSIPANITATMSQGDGIYDLILIKSGEVKTLLYGEVTIKKGVTVP